MHVDMKDTLTRRFANVDANVVPIRVILLINEEFYAIREFKHIMLFVLGEIKERCHMPPRYNKSMSGGDGEPIKKRDRKWRRSDDLSF